MDEMAIIEKIVESFKIKTSGYSKKLCSEGYNTEVYYIKNDKEKGYNFINAVIEFKNFFLKMEYKVHTSVLLPINTLEMRILFKGGKFPIEYSIYDLLNIIDKENFNCYTIPYIMKAETMEMALEYLFDTFVKYKDRIDSLFNNSEEFEMLEKNVHEQVCKAIGGNIFKSVNPEYIARMLEVYYILDAARFTSGIYADYVLNSEYKKAVKEYNKSDKKITLYEKRLKEHLLTLNGKIQFLPESLETIKLAKKYQKVSIKQRLLMILSFLVLSPAWTLLYGIIYSVTHIYLTKGSIYASNSEILSVIMFGFVTSAINVVFSRSLIAKWTFKEKYEEYKIFDLLRNGKKANNCITKLFQFVIAACIAFSVLAANTYISFANEQIVLKQGYFNLKGENISYDKVDSIYKVDIINDEIVGRIESENYVIILKDNTKIELYWYLTNEEIETNVLPIFKEKGIEMKTIDLITNIPNVEKLEE